MKKIFFLFIILFYTPANSAEVSKKEWNKKFPNVSYPKDNCEKCSRAHADWAYGWYRKATLMNRDYKSNGGLKSLNFNKSKNPSKIKKNINSLPKNIFNFVNNRDIMSLMVYENGELIYDWKRDYVDNSKPINGESRSKSIVGVVIATLKCQNKIDLNKNHSFYTKELKDSYYGNVTVLQSLNMMARDEYIVGYELNEIHRKKIDILTKANKYRSDLESPGENKFRYHNINTDLIMLDLFNILKGKKGFKKWFEKNIVEPAGFSNKSKLLLDKKGNGIGSSSFYLSREDWMRFGVYTMSLLNDPNKCEGKFLRDSFNKAPKTFKKFAPNYAMQFWLNGYGVKDLVQMRGHGLRLSLLDWKNNRIIQTNGFAISWKPQKLIDLIWN